MKRVPGFFSAQVSEARRFYLDLVPPPSARIAVVSGGCEHCAPDYRVTRPGFRYASIEFVAGGCGTLALKGGAHRLTPGTFFSYGPRVAQDIATDPRRPLVKYFVDFAGPDAVPLLARHGLAPGTVAQTSAPTEILAAFEDLIRSGLRDTRYTRRLCRLGLETLVLRLAESAVACHDAASTAFATFERCRRHIDHHWQRLGSLDGIARECHVDPAYLCRLFRRFGHESPCRHLARLRMNQAAELLREPGTMVRTVAAELGFSDAFHFSRNFKRVFGVAPARFIGLQRG
jgi:AraC-like DNA-binding protein